VSYIWLKTLRLCVCHERVPTFRSIPEVFGQQRDVNVMCGSRSDRILPHKTK
jgi:hypothetical protein